MKNPIRRTLQIALLLLALVGGYTYWADPQGRFGGDKARRMEQWNNGKEKVDAYVEQQGGLKGVVREFFNQHNISVPMPKVTPEQWVEFLELENFLATARKRFPDMPDYDLSQFGVEVVETTSIVDYEDGSPNKKPIYRRTTPKQPDKVTLYRANPINSNYTAMPDDQAQLARLKSLFQNSFAYRLVKKNLKRGETYLLDDDVFYNKVIAHANEVGIADPAWIVCRYLGEGKALVASRSGTISRYKGINQMGPESLFDVLRFMDEDIALKMARKMNPTHGEKWVRAIRNANAHAKGADNYQQVKSIVSQLHNGYTNLHPYEQMTFDFERDKKRLRLPDGTYKGCETSLEYHLSQIAPTTAGQVRNDVWDKRGSAEERLFKLINYVPFRKGSAIYHANPAFDGNSIDFDGDGQVDGLDGKVQLLEMVNHYHSTSMWPVLNKPFMLLTPPAAVAFEHASKAFKQQYGEDIPIIAAGRSPRDQLRVYRDINERTKGNRKPYVLSSHLLYEAIDISYRELLSDGNDPTRFNAAVAILEEYGFHRPQPDNPIEWNHFVFRGVPEGSIALSDSDFMTDYHNACVIKIPVGVVDGKPYYITPASSPQGRHERQWNVVSPQPVRVGPQDFVRAEQDKFYGRVSRKKEEPKKWWSR